MSRTCWDNFVNKHVGTIGKFGIISFNGNKIITTGGGGVILANKKKDAFRAKHISNTAKIDHNCYMYPFWL